MGRYSFRRFGAGASRRFAAAALAGLVAGLVAGCGELPADIPRGFAIVYGVADYAEVNDLNFPDDDASDIYDLLTSPGQGFSPEDVILRVNSQATKAQLEADFIDITARIAALPAPSITRFVFYFAGHGYGDGMSRFYHFPAPWTEYFSDPANSLEPVGAGPYNDYLFLHTLSVSGPASAAEVSDELRASAASDDEIAAFLAAIPSRQRVVVIDACHSGGFIGSGASVDVVPRGFEGRGAGISFFDALTALSAYGTAVGGPDIGADTVVITAAGEQEFSYEYSIAAGIENGVFTHYFLQAPDIADRNFDGLVTASEAYRHAARSVYLIEDPLLQGDEKFMPRIGFSGVDIVLFRAR